MTDNSSDLNNQPLGNTIPSFEGLPGTAKRGQANGSGSTNPSVNTLSDNSDPLSIQTGAQDPLDFSDTSI